MRHVIIGNGIAGIQGAESIRRLDPQASITVIAGEIHPPYCRPMISLVLEGAVAPTALAIRSPSFYQDMGIMPVSGEWVTEIDTETREVTTDKGSIIPFDRLLIASGADPRHIKAENADLKNIFFMRTESHVKGMIEALPKARRVLILGGGLVGFKAAHGFLRRGLPVTMLIRSGYPLSMQVDKQAGAMVLSELAARGLEVRVDCEAQAFHGNGEVKKAVLSDGSEISCDIVVVGKGVNPAVSFVDRDRIKVDLGIAVNDHLETTVPGIYAAGDVAEHYDIARNERWVNAIWPVAVEQGRIAGMNMAGRPVQYHGSLSRNVIRIYDMDVMTAGLVNPPDEDGYETAVRHDPGKKLYRKMVLKEGVLVGMVLVNNIEQGGVIMNLIHRKTPLTVSKERLLDTSFNFAQLLRQ